MSRKPELTEAQEDEALRLLEQRVELSDKRLESHFGVSANTIRAAARRAKRRRIVAENTQESIPARIAKK